MRRRSSSLSADPRCGRGASPWLWWTPSTSSIDTSSHSSLRPRGASTSANWSGTCSASTRPGYGCSSSTKIAAQALVAVAVPPRPPRPQQQGPLRAAATPPAWSAPPTSKLRRRAATTRLTATVVWAASSLGRSWTLLPRAATTSSYRKKKRRKMGKVESSRAEGRTLLPSAQFATAARFWAWRAATQQPLPSSFRCHGTVKDKRRSFAFPQGD
mmetsp:Transcript_40042/g.81782  ORF Transcript_40042/g.81782 Transcript_40042/m.81782 type:complete len:214 (-) Transcript_40042:594-1235(-)